MVIRNDEPEIAVAIGGDDLSSLPVATAVPATAFASDPNKNIERTTNADGSLMVKVTTTAHQSNGYREVTIEYFQVPASLADTVIMSMDATGEPPSSLYMTKMEQQVLPPGTSEVTSHAPTRVTTAPVASTTAAVVVASNVGRDLTPEADSTESRTLRGGWICFVIVAIFVTISNVARSLRRNASDNDLSAPSSPIQPFQPTLTPAPTREGCIDTPRWVDSRKRGCDYYESRIFSFETDRCSISNLYEGSMGPATENCCTCGGGSTFVTPAPWPSIAPAIPTPTKAPSPWPTQPSACVDTKGWVNSFGLGCQSYNHRLCYSGADFQGDMGPADENCCVCGGGMVPFNPSSSKAPTPTTSSTEVPNILSEVEVNATNNDSDESI